MAKDSTYKSSPVSTIKPPQPVKTVATYTTGSALGTRKPKSQSFSRGEILGLSVGAIATLALVGVVRRDIETKEAIRKAEAAKRPPLPAVLTAGAVAVAGAGVALSGGGAADTKSSQSPAAPAASPAPVADVATDAATEEATALDAALDDAVPVEETGVVAPVAGTTSSEETAAESAEQMT